MEAEQKNTPVAADIAHHKQPNIQRPSIVAIAIDNNLTDGERRSTTANEHNNIFLGCRNLLFFIMATITRRLPCIAISMIMRRMKERKMDSS